MPYFGGGRWLFEVCYVIWFFFLVFCVSGFELCKAA